MTSFLWYSSIVLLVILCGRTVYVGLENRFPAFVAYIYFSMFQWTSLFAVRKVGISKADYLNLYSIEELISTALLALCALDIYRNAYGPLRSQPSWVPRNVLRMVAASIASSVVMGTVLHSRNIDLALRVMNTVDQYVIGALCLSFWVIILYSFPLGRPWRRHNAGIAAGFVLCLTVNLCTVYIRALGGPSAALLAAYIGPASFELSVLWWCWRLWRPIPVTIFTRDRIRLELEIQREIAQVLASL